MSRVNFDEFHMYDVLSEYVDRCNKGEHFGIEIREVPDQPRQSTKVNFKNQIKANISQVNLFIDNVPLLKPRNPPVKKTCNILDIARTELEIGKTYKFNIIEVFDDIDGLLLMTGRMFQFKETFIEITKLLKKSLGENHPSNGYKEQIIFLLRSTVEIPNKGLLI